VGPGLPEEWYGERFFGGNRELVYEV